MLDIFANDLAAVEAEIDQVLNNIGSYSSKMALLIKNLFEMNGKTVRGLPMIILMTSEQEEENSENHRRKIALATGLELLNIANQMHQHANEWMKTPSVGSSSIANGYILVGDYLFAQSSTLVASTHIISAMRLLSTMLTTLSNANVQKFLKSANERLDQKAPLDTLLERMTQEYTILYTTAGKMGMLISGLPEEKSASVIRFCDIFSKIKFFSSGIKCLGKELDQASFDDLEFLYTCLAELYIQTGNKESLRLLVDQLNQPEEKLAGGLAKISKPYCQEIKNLAEQKKNVYLALAKEKILLDLKSTPYQHAYYELLDLVSTGQVI